LKKKKKKKGKLLVTFKGSGTESSFIWVTEGRAEKRNVA
jgi:hypothetical protein